MSIAPVGSNNVLGSTTIPYASSNGNALILCGVANSGQSSSGLISSITDSTNGTNVWTFYAGGNQPNQNPPLAISSDSYSAFIAWPDPAAQMLQTQQDEWLTGAGTVCYHSPRTPASTVDNRSPEQKAAELEQDANVAMGE